VCDGTISIIQAKKLLIISIYKSYINCQHESANWLNHIFCRMRTSLSSICEYIWASEFIDSLESYACVSRLYISFHIYAYARDKVWGAQSWYVYVYSMYECELRGRRYIHHSSVSQPLTD